MILVEYTPLLYPAVVATLVAEASAAELVITPTAKGGVQSHAVPVVIDPVTAPLFEAVKVVPHKRLVRDVLPHSLDTPASKNKSMKILSPAEYYSARKKKCR